MFASQVSLSGCTGICWMFECQTSSFGRIGQAGASGIAEAAARLPCVTRSDTATRTADARLILRMNARAARRGASS